MIAAGEGAGQVGLVGQAGGQRGLRRRFARGQQPLGLEQAQRHQCLLRRGVVLRLEAAQEVERAESGDFGQFFEGETARQVGAQVVDDGPDEDDQHQQPGFGRHGIGHRRPAQRRRHGARQAADDDVLRRARLQDDGVDDGVADERGEGQPHGERVDQRVQHEHAGAAQQAGQALL